MSTAIPIPRYNYSDYERWEGDWELINGYPYAMSPAPFLKHQLVAAVLQAEFFNALRLKRSSCNCKVVSESDWIIGADTVVRPDITIFCGSHDIGGHIKTPPVLIVEVFSPSTRLKDRNTKFKLYEEWGVKYYLMADPDLKQLEVFELTDNYYKEMPGKTDFQLTKNCSISINENEIFADV